MKYTFLAEAFGGGHKIAAGATIAIDKEKDFLEKVEKVLTSQMEG